MDTIPEQTREQIRKMSDDRLKQNLMTAGLPSAAVSALDRQALMSAWAEMVTSGQDKPISAAQALSDPELERQHLAFEERKWAKQAQLEADKIQLKKEKPRLHGNIW